MCRKSGIAFTKRDRKQAMDTSRNTNAELRAALQERVQKQWEAHNESMRRARRIGPVGYVRAKTFQVLPWVFGSWLGIMLLVAWLVSPMQALLEARLNLHWFLGVLVLSLAAGVLTSLFVAIRLWRHISNRVFPRLGPD